MSIFGKFGKKSGSKTTQEGSSSRGSRQSEQTNSPSNRPKSPIRPSSRNRGETIKKDFGELLNDINHKIDNHINFLKENHITPHNKANFEQNMRDTYKDTAKNLVELFKNLSEKNLSGYENYKSLNKLLDVRQFITNPDEQVIQLKHRILGLFLGDRLGNEERHLEAPSAKIYLSNDNQHKALIKKDDIIKLSKILNQLPSDAVKVFQKEVGIHPKEFDTLKNTLKDIEKEVVPFLSGEAKLEILKTSLSEMQDFHTLNNPEYGRQFAIRGVHDTQNNIHNTYNTGMTEHIENIFSYFTKINSQNEIDRKLLNFLTHGNSSAGVYTTRLEPIDYFIDKMNKKETATSQSDIEIMHNFFQNPHFQNSFQTKLNIDNTQFNKIKNTLSDILRTKHHKDEKLERQEHLKQASDVAKSIETLYTEEYRGEFQGDDTHLKQKLQNQLDVENAKRAKIRKEPILQDETANKHKAYVNNLKDSFLQKRDTKFLRNYNKIFHSNLSNPLETETQIVSLLLGKNIPEDKNPIQYFLEHHARSKVFNLKGIKHLNMILNHERIHDELPTDPYTIRKNKLITNTLNKIVTHYRDTIEYIKPFDELIKTNIAQIKEEPHFSHYNTDYIFKDEQEIERRLLGVIHSAGIQDEGYRYILNKTPYDNIQDIYQKAKEFSPEKKRNIKQIHNILQNLRGVDLKIFKDTYHCDDTKFKEIKNIFSKVVARLDDAGSSRANLRSPSTSSLESTATYPRRPRNQSSYSVSSSLPQKNIASSEINASVASSSATRANPQHSTVASSSGSTTNDMREPESFDLLGLNTPPASKDDVDLYPPQGNFNPYPPQGNFNPYPPTSSSAISVQKDLISLDDLPEVYTLMNPTHLEKAESSNTINLPQSNTIFSPADIEILTLVKSKNPFAEEEIPQPKNPFLPEVEAISPPKNPFLSDDIGDLLTGSTNLSPLNEIPYHPDYDLAILGVPKNADWKTIEKAYKKFKSECERVKITLLRNNPKMTIEDSFEHPEYTEAVKNLQPKKEAYQKLKKYLKES